MMRTSAFCLVFALGCGAARPQPTPDRAQIRFVIVPDTARIYTDGHYVGLARVLDHGVSFAPGPRQFALEADGYFPHDLALDLPSGETEVRIILRAIPE